MMTIIGSSARKLSRKYQWHSWPALHRWQPAGLRSLAAAATATAAGGWKSLAAATAAAAGCQPSRKLQQYLPRPRQRCLPQSLAALAIRRRRLATGGWLPARRRRWRQLAAGVRLSVAAAIVAGYQLANGPLPAVIELKGVAAKISAIGWRRRRIDISWLSAGAVHLAVKAARKLKAVWLAKAVAIGIFGIESNENNEINNQCVMSVSVMSINGINNQC